MASSRFQTWLALVAWALVAVGLTGCRGKAVHMRRRTGEFHIQPDGRVDVVETWVVDFRGGPFHKAYREIPFLRLTDVTDWQVAEGERAYRPIEDASQAQPYTFWVDADTERSRVTWVFPATRDARRTFTLHYTLHGALWVAADGDRFFYTFIEADRTYPIQTAQAVIRLPVAFSPAELDARAFRDDEPDPRAEVVAREDGTVYAQTTNLKPGQAWKVGVAWPHGAVHATPPPWQRAQIRRAIPQAYHATLHLLPEGQLQVREVWRLVFEGDAFTSFVREIPRRHLDEVTDWTLQLDGQPCPWADERSARGCGLLVKADDMAYRATWMFPPSREGMPYTFTFTYTVWGAVEQAATDTLALHLVDTYTLSWPTEAMTLALMLPTALQDVAQPLVRVEGQTLTPTWRDGRWWFTWPADRPRPLGLNIALAVQWPGERFEAPMPSWQQAQYVALAEYLVRVLRLAALTGLPLLAMGLVWFGLLLLEPPLWPWPWPRFHPPEDIPPALAGFLLDRRVLQRHVLATLWDLARRGHLRLERAKPSAPRGRAYRWRRLPGHGEPLRRFERRVLEAVFFDDRAQTCSLEVARLRLNRRWDDLAAAIAAEAHRQGWFRGRWARWAWLEKGWRWLFPLWLVLFLGGLLVLDPPARVQRATYGVGLVILAGMLFARYRLPRRLPPRTWRGWRTARAWIAYRLGLRWFRPRVAHDPRALAYATAFGLGPSWLRDAASPARGRAVHPWVHLPRSSPRPMGRPTSSRADDASMAADGPQHLDSATQALFEALDAAAHEVFTALNAAVAPTWSRGGASGSGSGASRSGFGGRSSNSRSFSSNQSSGGGSSGFE